MERTIQQAICERSAPRVLLPLVTSYANSSLQHARNLHLARDPKLSGITLATSKAGRPRGSRHQLAAPNSPSASTPPHPHVATAPESSDARGTVSSSYHGQGAENRLARHPDLNEDDWSVADLDSDIWSLAWRTDPGLPDDEMAKVANYWRKLGEPSPTEEWRALHARRLHVKQHMQSWFMSMTEVYGRMGSSRGRRASPCHASVDRRYARDQVACQLP